MPAGLISAKESGLCGEARGVGSDGLRVCTSFLPPDSTRSRVRVATGAPVGAPNKTAVMKRFGGRRRTYPKQ